MEKWEESLEQVSKETITSGLLWIDSHEAPRFVCSQRASASFKFNLDLLLFCMQSLQICIESYILKVKYDEKMLWFVSENEETCSLWDWI